MNRKIWIGIGVGGICLAVAIRGVAWSQVWGAISMVKPIPVFAGLALMFVTQWFRVRRWKHLLKPISTALSFKELFIINSVGFLMINVLPFRLGEMTRPLLLKRRHQIPFSTGIATIVVERVFDGLLAGILLFIGLVTLPSGAKELPGVGMGVRTLAWISMSIFVPILFCFFLAVWQKKRALRWLSYILSILPASVRVRAQHMAENFVNGLTSLPRMSGVFWITLDSMWVWGSVVMAYQLVLQAFGLSLPWGAPFTLLGVVAIGMTLPNAPLFVGAFQLFVQAALSLYGVSKSIGFAYGIVIHSLNLIYVIGVGLACLPLVAMPMKSLLETPAEPVASS